MAKIIFTVKRLHEIAIIGKRQSYADVKTRGLYLEITTKGKKTFSLLRSYLGRTYRHYIGVFPDVTLEQARRKCTELNSELDRGNDPNELRRKRKNEKTLDDLFFMYYKRHAQQRIKRPEAVMKNYRLYLSSIGHKRLSTITKSIVIDHHIALKNSISGRTANIMLTLLKAIFNRAIEWDEYDGKNPTIGIKPFKEYARSRFLDTGERKRFTAEINKVDDLIMRSFFLILLYTGQRKSNVLEMAWCDVDLVSKVWIIPVIKSDVNFRVPLSDYVVSLLQQLKAIQVNDYVFPSFGKTGHLVEPKRLWHKILEQAEIKNLRIHDLRRTFASMLSEQGINEFAIKDLLGHKTLDMTAIYARSSNKLLNEAVNSLVI